MKKLTKNELAYLEVLIDRAQSNGQPVPLFSEIMQNQYTAQVPPQVTQAGFNQIQATLAERGARYGDFTDHSRIADKLLSVLENHSRPSGPDIPTTCIPWQHLGSVKRQALRVIVDKLARIMNGDSDYDDNWIDIQGYAKLAQDRLPLPPETAPE